MIVAWLKHKMMLIDLVTQIFFVKIVHDLSVLLLSEVPLFVVCSAVLTLGATTLTSVGVSGNRCGWVELGELVSSLVALSSIVGQLIDGPAFPSLSSRARRALCL